MAKGSLNVKYARRGFTGKMSYKNISPFIKNLIFRVRYVAKSTKLKSLCMSIPLSIKELSALSVEYVGKNFSRREIYSNTYILTHLRECIHASTATRLSLQKNTLVYTS
jgi:hypothetical protein